MSFRSDDDKILSIISTSTRRCVVSHVSEIRLEKHNTYYPNMEYLGSIFCSITYIEGLKYFPNLVTISINCNQITDISVFRLLTKLTWIDLSRNKIEDISPLSELKNLEILRISHNPISDIRCLLKLENLIILKMNYTLVNNLDILGEMKKLYSVSCKGIRFNHIKEDLRFTIYVGKLDDLTSVNLYRTNNTIIPEGGIYDGYKFRNYKRRIRKVNNLLRSRIMILWFLFLEQKLDSYGYNRISYLSL